jgi:hypothetical protein
MNCRYLYRQEVIAPDGQRSTVGEGLWSGRLINGCLICFIPAEACLTGFWFPISSHRQARGRASRGVDHLFPP